MLLLLQSKIYKIETIRILCLSLKFLGCGLKFPFLSMQSVGILWNSICIAVFPGSSPHLRLNCKIMFCNLEMQYLPGTASFFLKKKKFMDCIQKKFKLRHQILNTPYKFKIALRIIWCKFKLEENMGWKVAMAFWSIQIWFHGSSLLTVGCKHKENKMWGANANQWYRHI